MAKATNQGPEADRSSSPIAYTVDSAAALEDMVEMPGYLMPAHEGGIPQMGRVSCSFCGVGDGATLDRVPETPPAAEAGPPPGTAGKLSIQSGAEMRSFSAKVVDKGFLQVSTSAPIVSPGGVVRGEFEALPGQNDAGVRLRFVGREVERSRTSNGLLVAHHFRRFTDHLTAYREVVRDGTPTAGCIKLRHSMMRQRAAYPIHTAPTVLDPETGKRRAISYAEAIDRFADLLLAHRSSGVSGGATEPARTLLYASGQCDYFAVFAVQEVFRLLGCRNLTGNAEHCLNAGAVHNEMLTGQEGPFLTIAQVLGGTNRVFLFNGWNGFIGHPPVFKAILSKPDLDAYLVEVMVTESAKALAEKLGKERVLLIHPRSDPHLALSVAHELMKRHPGAVNQRFIDRFGDRAAFESYAALACSEQFAPERVADRIAPEAEYAPRLLSGIQQLAFKFAQESVVPINIPSVGLSQTSGAVAHCLWGSLLGVLGKYGLNADGTIAGGTLRLAGQINAESEVQGMSRKYFMGRLPIAQAADAARRMGLPPDAYDAVLRDTPRAALDYSDPTPGTRELFVCMGTQFEANMMGRRRWIEKLETEGNALVVIDPIPDPFSEEHAALIIPSPPHPAAPKLYQNGEWKFTLSVPQKKAAPETRSDATILYDAIASITKKLQRAPELAAAHPDLARLAASGYLGKRFCPPEDGGGLTRIGGEVSRAELWERILDYLGGGQGPLYCLPEYADGRPIPWTELVERGSVYYGGIGTTRYKLDYDDPDASPYRDVLRRPQRFRFFTPTPLDLEIPTGTLFNSGRSTLYDERERIAFAIGTFNSGKATPLVGMPDENPLFVSPSFAHKNGLSTGQRVKLRSPDNGADVELPVVVSDRVKGDSVYASFHKSRAQMERGVYINDVTSHEGRCPYTSQTSMKATRVVVERAVKQEPVVASDSASRRTRVDTTHIDPLAEIPIWPGRDRPLQITDILHETHDVYTLRLQGDPLCRFAYYPGQYITFNLPIDGKRVLRSYSVSSTPTRPYVLEVTIKRVPGGLVSNWIIDNLKVGDKLDLTGPKGKFCLVPGKIPKKLLFLAAGSGITPLMSMARLLCDVAADVDLKFFNSVRSPNDVVYHEELQMMSSRYRMFEPIVITSSRGPGKGWTGLSGRISRSMIELVAPDLHDRHVYTCGPEGFMAEAKRLLGEMGFDLAHLHAESFGAARTAPVVTPDGTEEGEFHVEFARAGKRVRAKKTLPLLELAESHDVTLDYGCRTGSCGDCKVRLLSGEVASGGDGGLTDEERAAGWVLSCVSTPKADCVIDA